MHLNSINQNFFHTKARRVGYHQAYQVWLQYVLTQRKRQFKLVRIKSRLRVSFIGYSYNIKFK